MTFGSIPGIGIHGVLKRDNMEKFLILGSGGMLGYGVSEYFKKNGFPVNALSRKDYDILSSDIKILEEKVIESDVIINCIGVIKPMIVQYSELDVLKINSIFPRNLSAICSKHNKELIHISTDCVYSGKKGNYDERELFDADDMYGISKNGGDIKDCMTLRTSFIGPELGHKRSLLEWVFSQKGKKANGFTNHLWNGVTTIYFAEIAESIIKKGLYENGIFHIFSPQPVTKYELLVLINDIFSLNIEISESESPEKIDRSLSSLFKLSSIVSVKPVRTQLMEVKDFFKL
jgi:dTDP-4-dehydrorhamnose reductase